LELFLIFFHHFRNRITPAVSAKKEIKASDIIKADQKEATSTQSDAGAEKKLPWYRRIFSWLF
jgi:hypothetical protein